MGQKVHPTGIRLGVVKDHNSVWYADSKDYASQLVTDLEVREYILKRLDAASVSRVVIERPAQTARVTIHTARPGIVIGKNGEDVEALRQELSKRMGVPVHITIEEIRKPDMDARLVAQNVAQQLERRVMFRRAMKRVVQNAMRQGAEGIKVQVGGRLGGAEITVRWSPLSSSQKRHSRASTSRFLTFRTRSPLSGGQSLRLRVLLSLITRLHSA